MPAGYLHVPTADISLVPNVILEDPEVGRADPIVQQMGHWESGTYFGDGGGGIYTSYTHLRRCGVGVAKYSPGNTNFDYGF